MTDLTPAVKDTMLAEGVWAEDGRAWFPREHVPTRSAARRMYASLTDVSIPLSELKVRAQWMHHWTDDDADDETLQAEARYYDGDYWLVCKRGDKGAIPVWRVE